MSFPLFLCILQKNKGAYTQRIFIQLFAEGFRKTWSPTAGLLSDDLISFLFVSLDTDLFMRAPLERIALQMIVKTSQLSECARPQHCQQLPADRCAGNDVIPGKINERRLSVCGACTDARGMFNTETKQASHLQLPAFSFTFPKLCSQCRSTQSRPDCEEKSSRAVGTASPLWLCPFNSLEVPLEML